MSELSQWLLAEIEAPIKDFLRRRFGMTEEQADAEWQEHHHVYITECSFYIRMKQLQQNA